MLGENGDVENAKLWLKRAEECAKKIVDSSRRGYALRLIARSWAEIGEVTRDREALFEAEERSKIIMAYDGAIRASALRKIAGAWISLGDGQKAGRLLKEAVESAKADENDREWIPALCEIAECWAKTDSVLAGETLMDAEHIAKSNFNTSFEKEELSSALGNIAVSWARIGNPSKGHELLKEAKAVADGIEGNRDKWLRCFALWKIAASWLKSENANEAEKILIEAEKVGKEIKDACDQIYVLCPIAELWTDLRKTTKSMELLEETVDSANKMKERRVRQRIIGLIAESVGKVAGSTCHNDADA